MPYLIKQDGSLDFIENQQEYNQLQNAEFAPKEVSPSKSETTKDELPSDAYDYSLDKPQDTTLDKVNETIESNDEILNQPWAQDILAGKPLLGTTPDKWSDIGTQIMQKIRPTDERAALIEKNREDDPKTEDEFLRMMARAPQSGLNAAISFPEQLLESGYLDPSYITHKMGLDIDKLGGNQELAKRYENVFKQYETNAAELEATGRIRGQRLGYKNNWPLGKYISNDSPWVQENVVPNSEVVDLSAKVLGAIGVIRVLGAMGAIGQVFGTSRIPLINKPIIPAGVPLTKTGKLKQVVKGFTLSAIQEGKEEALLFPPDPADIDFESLNEYREALKGLKPSEQMALQKAWTAQNETEYNYYVTQVTQAAVGGGIAGTLNVTGQAASDFLGKIFKSVFKTRRLVDSGVPLDDAIEKALVEVKPELDDAYNKVVKEEASQNISEQIGEKTIDFENNVSNEIPDAAEKVRDLSEDFIVKSGDSVKKIEELTNDVTLTTDTLTNEKNTLLAEIQAVKKTLNVKTEEDLAKKISILDERMANYSLILEKDPDWITKSTGSGKKRTKNKTKFRLLEKAINNIKKLEELQFKLEGLEKLEADNAAKVTEITKAETNVVSAATDFQKGLNDLRDTVKENSELLDQRTKLVDIDTAQKVGVEAEPISTAIEKVPPKTPLARLLRMAPDGMQGQIAIQRLDEALKKVDKGFTKKAFKDRTVVDTAGDLINMLNVARVVTEESVQKALRDVETVLIFIGSKANKLKRQILEEGKAIRDIEKGKRIDTNTFDNKLKQLSGTETKGELPPAKDIEDPWDLTSQEGEILQPDTYLASKTVAYHNQLSDLLDEAQSAIDSDSLTPEFMNDWVKRIDAVNNSAIADGISPAPITTQLDQIKNAAEQQQQKVLEPKVEPPLKTPVPLKVEGEDLIPDIDGINQLIDVSTKNTETPPTTKYRNQFLQQAEEINAAGMTAKTAKAFDSITEDVDKLIDELTKLSEYDKIHNTNLVEDRLEILRTAKATTYTPDLSNQALLKVVSDRITKKGRSQTSLAISSILQLAQFTNDPDGVRQLAFLLQQGRINRANLKKIHSISTTLSLLDFNTRNAMKSVSDLKSIQNGIDVKGLSVEQARALALSNITKLFVAVRAVDPLAEQYGKGLAQFKRVVRPKYYANRSEFFADAWNQALAAIDEPDELLDKVAKAGNDAVEAFETTMGSTMKKLENGQDLTDDEIAKVLSLSDALYRTGGNLRKINEIEKTSTGVMNGIIRSGILSTPAGPFGIIGQATVEAVPRHTATWAANLLTSPFLKYVGKETLKPEMLRRARLHRLWGKAYLYSLMNSWDDFYNKMVFPEAHPDYVPNPVSLLNEQAKLDDLRAKQISVPVPFIGKWVMNRAGDNPFIFDFINKGRVLFKSMHDSFASGDKWNKLRKTGWIRGIDTGIPTPFSKTKGSTLQIPGLGFTTAGMRALGLGTKQFYKGAEDEAMTGVMKTLGMGDGLFTSVSGNAYFRAITEMEVGDDVAAGLIPQKDFKKEVFKRLNKEVSNIYKPIKVGIDGTTIGYQIMDKQFTYFKDLINLTEELTGGSRDLKESIRVLQNSEDPYVSAVASYLMPVTHSSFNWIQNAASIATGFELVKGTYDITRGLGYIARNNLGEKVERMLPQKTATWLSQNSPGVLKNIKEFSSDYISDDPVIREKAQQAFALALAWQGIAMNMVWNSDTEITGPMTHTYREAKGIKKPFHIKLPFPIPGFYEANEEIPLLYLGTFGSTLALHTTIRVIAQFSNTTELTSVVGFAAAGFARQLMEVPTLAGPDKVTEALARADQGDVRYLQRLFASYLAVVGRPYAKYEKMLKRTFITKQKMADPVSGLSANKYFKKGKAIDNILNPNAAFDTVIGTFGYLFEETGIGSVVNGLTSVLADDETIWLATRQAMPYGEPGEVIEWSDMPRLAYPIQAATERFFPIKSRSAEPVNKARLENLIPPVGPDIFSSSGVGLNKTALNEFQHFLNTDALIKSNYSNKVHVGIKSYILELINRPEYQQLQGSDVSSPYVTGNWDRKNSTRANWIKNSIRNKINIVKWQWVDGGNQIPDPDSPTGYRDQLWVADPELRQLINQQREY